MKDIKCSRCNQIIKPPTEYWGGVFHRSEWRFSWWLQFKILQLFLGNDVLKTNIRSSRSMPHCMSCAYDLDALKDPDNEFYK